jgi:hypothetical protein
MGSLHTRTRIPDGYEILPNNVPAGTKFLPYPPPYRVKPVGYSGFGYPLPFLVATGEDGRARGELPASQPHGVHPLSPKRLFFLLDCSDPTVNDLPFFGFLGSESA